MTTVVLARQNQEVRVTERGRLPTDHVVVVVDRTTGLADVRPSRGASVRVPAREARAVARRLLRQLHAETRLQRAHVALDEALAEVEMAERQRARGH
jgi:hypothetical protein